MRRASLVASVSNLLIPPILLFGLYVQFHGDYGPGGGFQAGVIFAVAIILHSLIHGLDETRARIPDKALTVAMSVGVLLFAGVGFTAMGFGGEFLNYSLLLDDPLAGQHLGIIVIEFGIGVTVAATLVTLFYAFAGRRSE